MERLVSYALSIGGYKIALTVTFYVNTKAICRFFEILLR